MKKTKRNSIIILATIMFLMAVGTVAVFKTGSLILKTAWQLNEISGQITFLSEKPATERWENDYDRKITELYSERKEYFYESENHIVRWFSRLGTDYKLVQYTIIIAVIIVMATTIYVWIDILVISPVKRIKRLKRKLQQRRASA